MTVRNRLRSEPYRPETGEGSVVGERIVLHLPDAPIPMQYIPREMLDEVELVSGLRRCGSLSAFIEKELGYAPCPRWKEEVWRRWVKVRIRYDFEFWAVMFVRVKDKMGDGDVPFRLNRPQRKLLLSLETQRRSGKPVRLILLKARQWGGSTARATLYGVDTVGSPQELAQCDMRPSERCGRPYKRYLYQIARQLSLMAYARRRAASFPPL